MSLNCTFLYLWLYGKVHSVLRNKDNSIIPLFETHELIERNKSGLQTKTEGNALNIRGEHRHNIKM